MTRDIPTRYDPKEIEERIYKSWEDEKSFHAETGTGKVSYSIVIPPPNITGVLHMGHALNNTIQDILVRWKRMQGYETLWLPGTDHAGIATQNVVERDMSAEGVKRRDLGREKFLERIWQWKDEYGNTIIKQLKKLGCSCDWERIRFTMDEGLSNAVMEVFARLYKENLLYKGDYIINWCPRCETALSDEEAEHADVDGILYYIKYPIKGRERLKKENEDYVVVATTRPETMLGDVAVAVNPKDPRYAGIKGKTLMLPIVKRELRIIFDETVDQDFGTGALKVTPAHDSVDFELGIKHGLPRVNVLNPDGTINALGGGYEGMDRFECREAIVEDLRQRKLFIKFEEHPHSVGHCYRCHTMIEPRLSKQWFVSMKPLAKEAIQVVHDEKIKFYPERWTKVYLNWMKNIRDWCISRQIWWGHRIPVWYCLDCLGCSNVRDVEVMSPDKKGVFLRLSEGTPDKCPICGSKNIEQDPDVLDTWFSSWLWPFSTMGWPEKSEELKTFYPTDALVTAQEIIFFWVARMIMAGLWFQKEIPFRDVYIHGTVRDQTGTKMSKSLGNVIDPLDIIDEVGCDALRFSIISITSQGQDVFLSRDKFEFGRNFANKLWNASRYVLMNQDGNVSEQGNDPCGKTLADRWIVSVFNETIREVQRDLVAYRFNDAASALYEFIWHKYCDWYLEFSKLAEDRVAAQNTLLTVLDGILRLLHPFMPFITEAIWQNLPERPTGPLINAAWPVADSGKVDTAAVSDTEKIIDAIVAIRNVRSFWGIAVKTIVDVDMKVADDLMINVLKENSRYMEKLAKCRLRNLGADVSRPKHSVAVLTGGIRLFIPLGETIDVEKEAVRVSKKIEEIENYLITMEKKLANKDFIGRAPEEVVKKEKAKKARFEQQVETLKENLEAIR
ncbi:MAG: valine--tRNA ligase [Candidatus Omnitrophica bacterium]|nr:valine--tRNA ligase [Candidatus Omnitrophota bacterium]